MAATFQEIFESILNIHAPVRKKRPRSQFAPWDILKQEAERSPEKWSAYKKLRNKVTRAAERGEQEGQIAPEPQGLRGLIIEEF